MYAQYPNTGSRRGLAMGRAVSLVPQADDVLCTDLTALSDPVLHYPISSDVRSPPSRKRSLHGTLGKFPELLRRPLRPWPAHPISSIKRCTLVRLRTASRCVSRNHGSAERYPISPAMYSAIVNVRRGIHIRRAVYPVVGAYCIPVSSAAHGAPPMVFAGSAQRRARATPPPPGGPV